MKEAMKALGINCSPADIQKMMAAVDEDNSGMISYEEFKILMTERMASDPEDAAKDVQKAFGVR